MPRVTTRLSDAQIAGAAKSAGFSGNALAKAVAIAIGESGGNPTAHNPRGLDNSYGLWQINMLGAMGPARRKQFGLKSNTDLFDPGTNARAAYAISSGGKNFRPWSVYTSGKYLLYMSRANKAAGNPDTSGSASQAGFLDDVNPFPEIIAFFEFISDPKTWFRLGMILGGGVLIAVALVQLSGASGKAKELAKVATDILPQGKALKAGKASKAAKAVG